MCGLHIFTSLAPAGVYVTSITHNSTVVVIGKPERSIQIKEFVVRIKGGTPDQTCSVRENAELMQCQLLHLEPSTTYAVLVEACLYNEGGCGLPAKVSFQTRGNGLRLFSPFNDS